MAGSADIFNAEAARYDAWFDTNYRYAHFHTLGELLEMPGKAGLEVEGTASTLLQPPEGSARTEEPQTGLVNDAGFVCVC